MFYYSGDLFFTEWDHSNGRAGRPLSCLEVKLESWEEGRFNNQKKNVSVKIQTDFFKSLLRYMNG